MRTRTEPLHGFAQDFRIGNGTEFVFPVALYGRTGRSIAIERRVGFVLCFGDGVLPGRRKRGMSLFLSSFVRCFDCGKRKKSKRTAQCGEQDAQLHWWCSSTGMENGKL